jgi:hypothetical protein
MIAPSARMMSLVPLQPAKAQKTTLSDDRQHLDQTSCNKILEWAGVEPEIGAPDAHSGRWRLVRQADGKSSVVIDGKEGKPYDAILDGTPVFSVDGTRWAYAARSRSRWYVIAEGNDGEGRPWKEIQRGSLRFTPKTKRLVWIAREPALDVRYFVLLDDQEVNPSGYSEIQNFRLQATEEGENISYWCVAGGWTYVSQPLRASAGAAALVRAKQKRREKLAYIWIVVGLLLFLLLAVVVALLDPNTSLCNGCPW